MDEYDDNNGVPPVTGYFRHSSDEKRVVPAIKKHTEDESNGN